MVTAVVLQRLWLVWQLRCLHRLRDLQHLRRDVFERLVNVLQPRHLDLPHILQLVVKNVPRGSMRVVHSYCSIAPSSHIAATPAVSSAFSATSAFASASMRVMIGAMPFAVFHRSARSASVCAYSFASFVVSFWLLSADLVMLLMVAVVFGCCFARPPSAL